ncbi:hypothetical protein SUGI_1086150 [Cryptomeria japonica]|nr:hypothetical protein SUGI_1086150 [Cryptomeria japonica]
MLMACDYIPGSSSLWIGNNGKETVLKQAEKDLNGVSRQYWVANDLPTCKAIQFKSNILDYLLGIGDLIGELMRLAISQVERWRQQREYATLFKLFARKTTDINHEKEQERNVGTTRG